MLKEIEKYDPKHKFSLFLQVLGIVAFVLLFSWVCSILRILFNAPFLEYLPFVAAIALALFIYRYRIVEYRHTLIDDTLKIDKLAGRRESNIATLSLKSVIGYTDYNKKNCAVKPKYKCLFSSSKNRKLLIYRQSGEEHALVFAPSDSLDERIRELLADDRAQAKAENEAPSPDAQG